ncbi:hypothetical protein pdam_00018080 [Pocillopora damicornis]|uniref:Serine-threonine/tyrosine-protein kinase catalytic domain-containing protein n=1 Tax=Pocillopora damicornis TaxID=46731 RepID=A0A3M6V5W3_POCDA|nr:hypothetical protein pdam_00018080 [Pocillopora damicornis]
MRFSTVAYTCPPCYEELFILFCLTGDSPYPEIPAPLALVKRLSAGYRLSCPHQCSEELYTKMTSYWNEDPLMRPSFADIVDQPK